MGSEAAFEGKKEGSIYCATKFALRGFCQALRQECGSSSVKVSIVHPSLVNTPFYQNLSIYPKSSILAEDIADWISYLLHSRDRVVFDEIMIKPKTYVIEKKSKNKNS